MQTLALISLYTPIVIIIVAVVAVLFSFFWVFLPLARWASDGHGAAVDTVLALARAAAATLITKDGNRNLERELSSGSFSQRYLIYDRSATLANVLLEHLHPAAVVQNVYQLVDVVGFGQDGNDGLSGNYDRLFPVENRHGSS